MIHLSTQTLACGDGHVFSSDCAAEDARKIAADEVVDS
jgi:hypothetical protein